MLNILASKCLSNANQDARNAHHPQSWHVAERKRYVRQKTYAGNRRYRKTPQSAQFREKPEHPSLLLYKLNTAFKAITAGTDAQGEVTVRLQDGDHIVNGQGKDTDIVVASAKALIDALNKLPGMHAREVHAQYSGV